MAITVSEFTPAYTASGSTVSTTKTCTAGSAVVVFFYTSEWNSPPTPSCTVGGSAATLVQSPNQSAGNPFARCYYILNIAGGSTTVTVNGYAAGRGGQLLAVELAGAATSAALDASASHWATSSGQAFYGAPAGGITVASGATAVACQMVSLSPGTLTPDTGWTALSGESSELYCKVMHKAFPAGGSAQRGLNQGAENDREYYGMMISILAAGGGSSATPLTGGLTQGILTKGRLIQ